MGRAIIWRKTPVQSQPSAAQVFDLLQALKRRRYHSASWPEILAVSSIPELLVLREVLKEQGIPRGNWDAVLEGPSAETEALLLKFGQRLLDQQLLEVPEEPSSAELSELQRELEQDPTLTEDPRALLRDRRRTRRLSRERAECHPAPETEVLPEEPGGQLEDLVKAAESAICE